MTLSAPHVVSGGEQATATAVVNGGQVTGIAITNPGFGYVLPPSVSLTGGGGTGANVSSALSPTSLLRIDVSSGGSGYLSGVTIDIGLPIFIPRFAGIRPAVEPPTYVVGHRYLPQAFGKAPDGSDGGAFVEFIGVPGNLNSKVPKYAYFPDYKEWYKFSNYWFDRQSERKKNVLHQLSAYSTCAKVGGWGYSVNESVVVASLSVVFIGKASNSNAQYRDEVAAHEIGHRFDLTQAAFSYIDTYSSVTNHCATDMCLMSYNNVFGNEITEFSLEAIVYGNSAASSIRDLEDK